MQLEFVIVIRRSINITF